MVNEMVSVGPSRRVRRILWCLTILLVAIGFAAAGRRTYALFWPSTQTRFPAGAALDAGFWRQKMLTLAHILPSALLIVLMALQFSERIRTRHLQWHRWSGRVLVGLGLIVGTTALIMSFSMTVGGPLETAATTIYAVLFLTFLLVGFWNIRHRRIERHREWMIRAFGVILGIAATRPVVALFFAAGRMTPQEFFGIAFWIGFTMTSVAAEAWVRYTRRFSKPVGSNIRAAVR